MLYVMLVGAYPFERPEDKNDPQKLQKMITRIVNVDYHIPSRLNLSKECRDLLGRILVKDPNQRISIAEIYRHPWYRTDLPYGVDTMNDTWDAPMAGVQSVEEIQQIVQEARQAVSFNDNFIDEAIDDVGASGTMDDSFASWSAPGPGIPGGIRG